MKDIVMVKDVTSGRRSLGATVVLGDWELLGYGIMLGLLIAHFVLKLAQDVRSLLQAGQDIASVFNWLRGLCCGSRATPTPSTTTTPSTTSYNEDPQFPGLPLRVYHVRTKPKAVHLRRECSQFYENSDVVLVPVCVTCLREKRKQLGSEEKEQ